MDVDPAAGDQGGAVFRLVYRSHSRIPAPRRRAVLGELFSQARSNNKKRSITGALLLTDEWFVQTLEGDETQVRELYDRIAADPRHESLELLEQGQVAGRVFARWAMAKVSDGDAPDIPLIAHVDGISKAAPRGDATEEQEGLLKIMRDAARA